MTDEDWSKWFEQLLENYLIEVPSDYFIEDVGFDDDPEKLQQIFTDLEEKNLTWIHNTQDLQQQLDE